MKHCTVLVYLLVLCCLLGACDTKEMPITIDEEASYFDNFVVIDDFVYIYCTVFLNNDSTKTYEVELYGTFEKDYVSGLLTEERILAVTADDTSSHILTVPPGGYYFDVVFIGGHGGNPTKHDRLLPELEIIFANKKP